MPPDNPPQHSALPRNRVVEVIERAQEDALRQLRAAGIPGTQALLVMQWYAAFVIQVLKEMDLLYREFEQLLASDPDRSQAHQEWLDTKAGGLLLTIDHSSLSWLPRRSTKQKQTIALSSPSLEMLSP